MKNSLPLSEVKRLMDVALSGAELAARYLKQHAGLSTEINTSIGKDIKLQSDVESEKILFDSLKQTGINILSEEAGYIEVNTNNKELLWIVDPLDGSLNYSRGIPIYCISIGLWKNEIPLGGLIYDLNNKRVLLGVVGLGAWLNNEEIKVSSVYTKSNSIICTGFSVYSSFDTSTLSDFVNTLQAYKKVRLLGSAALSLGFVASGCVEAYSELNIAWWDVAAGIALTLSAGGSCDFNFTNREKNLMNVYASNGLI